MLETQIGVLAFDLLGSRRLVGIGVATDDVGNPGDFVDLALEFINGLLGFVLGHRYWLLVNDVVCSGETLLLCVSRPVLHRQ